MKRNTKEIVKYMDEAFDKVWYVRAYSSSSTAPGKEEAMKKNRRKI